MSEIVNGYEISGNLAESKGRKYTVSNSGGVVYTTEKSKRDAMDHAESLPAGDVSEDAPDDTEGEAGQGSDSGQDE